MNCNADELPIGWGLLEAKNGKLRTIREASARKAKTIDRCFLMSIIRNFESRCVPKQAFDALVAKKTEERIEEAIAGAQCDGRSAINDLEKLRAQLKGFEEASGIKIHEWSDGYETGRLVKLIREHGHNKIREQFEWSLRGLKSAAAAIEHALKEEPCQPTQSS